MREKNKKKKYHSRYGFLDALFVFKLHAFTTIIENTRNIAAGRDAIRIYDEILLKCRNCYT